MFYIDVHTHIFPHNIAAKVVTELENYYGYPWSGTGETDDLLNSMQEAGPGKAVIFSSATKPEQVESINNFLAASAAENPDRFIGFGTMHPDYDRKREEIDRLIKLGLRGLKFHPDFQRFNIDDPSMLEIYEIVGDRLPMIFHVGDPNVDYSSPERLSRVLARYPQLKIIAAHMGGFQSWDKARQHLIGKNLWLDISSTIIHISPAETAALARQHGIEKILFATDYPAQRHKDVIKDVLSLGFSPEENEMVFHRNAEKLLQLTN